MKSLKRAINFVRAIFANGPISEILGKYKAVKSPKNIQNKNECTIFMPNLLKKLKKTLKVFSLKPKNGPIQNFNVWQNAFISL